MKKNDINFLKFKFSAFLTLALFIFKPLNVFAQNQGLSVPDLEFIKIKVSIAKVWIGQFKPFFDDHIGKISTSFLNDNFIREQYVAISFSFLVILLLIEIILSITEKSNFSTLLPRFITSLVASIAYVGIITATITLANGFMFYLMDNTGSFIDFSKSTLDVLNLQQDSGSTLVNTVQILNPNASVSNVTGMQTKFVVDLLLILLSIFPLIIGISQYVADIVISVMFLISPFVAITHIHGAKMPFIKNFWNIFFDLVVGKIAFTLSYTLLVTQIKDKISSASGGLNIGLAFFIIGNFIAMGAVTMAIREVFNIASNYNVRDKIQSSSSTPGRVVQSTTNVISSGIRTVGSIRRGF